MGGSHRHRDIGEAPVAPAPPAPDRCGGRRGERGQCPRWAIRATPEPAWRAWRTPLYRADTRRAPAVPLTIWTRSKGTLRTFQRAFAWSTPSEKLTPRRPRAIAALIASTVARVATLYRQSSGSNPEW